jgi:hypothetical protein
MNRPATFGDEWQTRTIAVHKQGTCAAGESSAGGATMSGLAAFLSGVGVVSLICYLLMTRVQNRSAVRSSAGDSSGTDGSPGSGGGDILSWFSSDNSTSDNSGASSDFSGGDGGGAAGGEVAMAAEAEVTSDARTPSTIDVLACRNMAF